jgi:hypothetical protein
MFVAKLIFLAAVDAKWSKRDTRILCGKTRNVVNVLLDIFFWVRLRINSLLGIQSSLSENVIS